LQKRQLLIRQDSGDATLPIEDITAIILESPQITLTSALLAACHDYGITTVSCDDRHMPNGIMLPFHAHSRQTEVGHLQLTWSKPLRKRLWQSIVRQKIINQSKVLRQFKPSAGRHLYRMARHVKSGDPGNVEARAARYYWPKLFGPKFKRHGNDKINAALNYGYAVLRAVIARSVVSYGLLPSFGIHHDNNLNAFNLVDDLLEPFRPMADYQIRQYFDPSDTNRAGQLSIEDRQTLAGLSHMDVIMPDGGMNMTTASDIMTASLVTAIRQSSHDMLALPDMKTTMDTGDAG
jgi:CRISPR-associated protein Cas1